MSWLRVDFASAFNKITAYLGLATGILGIVSLTGLTLTIIMNAIFATVWILVVGYGLCRLAQEQSPRASVPPLWGSKLIRADKA